MTEGSEVIVFGAAGEEPTVIRAGDRMLDSDVSLKIYMDHLLQTDFGVRILLPDNAFNPLDNRYETISVSEAAQLCDVEKKISTKKRFF